jgi:hypothetical protein
LSQLPAEAIGVVVRYAVPTVDAVGRYRRWRLS